MPITGPTEGLETDNPSRPFDVVIAGAGLAGGTLALRLARAGACVALADASRFPRDKLCGEFLSPECRGVFERLGLGREVGGLGGRDVRRTRITTPSGRSLDADLTGPDGLPGLGLSRSALDLLILRSAREAGVTVFEEARVTGPIVRDGKVVGMLARRGAGPAIELLGGVTVAADGRRSVLVSKTGQTRAGAGSRPGFFGLKRHLAVADGGKIADPDGTVGLHLVAGGYVGTCRVDGGMINLCGLLPESLLKRWRGDLDAMADAEFPANPSLGRLWASANPAGEWKTVAGARVESSRPTLPGPFFVGDCQGTIDPLGGQGMTMALLGAEMLAPAVLDALASGEGASPARQQAWELAWHRRFDRRVWLCRCFHQALVRPRLIDAASHFKSLATRLVSLGYERTRDPSVTPRRLEATNRF